MIEKDFGQLCWDLYKDQTKDSLYHLYKNKEDLLRADYIIHEKGLRLCKYWAFATFFGIENARTGLGAVCEMAKGYLCRISFSQTFCWIPSEKGKPKRCQRGWEAFIIPANEPCDVKVPCDYLPSYEDERFGYYLDLKTLGLKSSSYSYSFRWVDGVYTFKAGCYSREGLKIFKNIFPEFPAKVTGNARDGWEVVVQIPRQG